MLLALLQNLIDLLTGSLWTYPILFGICLGDAVIPALPSETAVLVRLHWATRFMPYIFIAAILWACYGALLGYLGGRTFRDQPIYALLLALGIAAAITVGVEVFRRVRM